jgi:4-hydroxy-tetrahydrodipicolinate reductase
VKSLAIVGGAGRMGQVLAQGLSAQDDLVVTALIDVVEPRELFGASYAATLDELDPTGVDAVVEFSSPASVAHSATWCATHAVGLVIGTTGLTNDQRAAVDAAAERTAIIMATNFSVGVVLQERFAKMAAPYFERVEIIELHHDKKADAPSGTSLSTARGIAQARREAGLSALEDPTTHHSAAGARGADGADGIKVHSVRLPGLVSHQEVLFGGPGEGLTIRHDSFDRVSFVHGVVLALRALGATPGLTIGIDSLIT